MSSWRAVKTTPPGIRFYDSPLSVTVGSGSKSKPTAATSCLSAASGSTALSIRGSQPLTWYSKKNCAAPGSAAP